MQVALAVDVSVAKVPAEPMQDCSVGFFKFLYSSPLVRLESGISCAISRMNRLVAVCSGAIVVSLDEK